MFLYVKYKNDRTQVDNFHLALLFSIIVILLWSLINPKDLLVWFLEVLPAIVGIIILIFSYKSFRLTDLTYFLIFIYMIILIVGGHYTYAEMPIFNWLKEEFNLYRNYYDRVGHFAQGFVPAIIAREVLLRKTALRKGKMLFFIVLSICLGISAFYELIEWWIAVASGEGEAAVAFLATQGDVWDTQWDMFLALLGSFFSQILLSRIHDRELKKVSKFLNN